MNEENNIIRHIKFDERRKVLSVKTEETKDAMNGEVNGGKLKFVSDAEYNENGIKMILGNAKKIKDDSEKFIPMCRDRIKEIEEDMEKAGNAEMTPDLVELEEKLKKIKTIKDSEPKQKELDNLKSMLKNAEDNLEKSAKDMQDIKKEIGSRLNLE